MSPLEPAVRLENLSRRYGREVVLHDLTLQIREGRTVVLHGPNGAGKTTLLRILATRLRPTSGHGAVLGFDMIREAHEVRRRISTLSVFGGSYPMLTALENLRLAATLYGTDPSSDSLTEHLDRVDLTHARDKLVRTFSSGMKKRLGIARLRLSDSRVWLLDEPYAALDEDGKSLVDTLLEQARNEGKTVLLASHELDRVRVFADAVLQVENGGVSVRERMSRDD